MSGASAASATENGISLDSSLITRATAYKLEQRLMRRPDAILLVLMQVPEPLPHLGRGRQCPVHPQKPATSNGNIAIRNT